jgi:hypothetical protein
MEVSMISEFSIGAGRRRGARLRPQAQLEQHQHGLRERRGRGSEADPA